MRRTLLVVSALRVNARPFLRVSPNATCSWSHGLITDVVEALRLYSNHCHHMPNNLQNGTAFS